MSDAYSVLAGVYDRLMDASAYAARAEYLWELFIRHGGTPATLLDIGCGTGRLTQLLQEKGADIIGADASPEMLSQARERLGGDALLLCQDMRELDLYGDVEGVVCTMDGMNHLLTQEDITRTLKRIALFVQPDGRFIFDVNTPYKHREILGDRCFALEDEGIMCIWQNSLLEDDVVCAELDIFKANGTQWTRHKDTVQERAYSMSEWQNLLTEAGFITEAIYGDGTFTSPIAEEERWVIVARRTV